MAAASRIAAGSREKLQLGNTAIVRDWGWAPEYVEAMWMMLQQDGPHDYVIATGESHSLEEFAEAAFGCVGLDWREHAVIDPGLLRPADITIGRANPSRAAKQLGWQASYKMADVVRMMVEEELRIANRESRI